MSYPQGFLFPPSVSLSLQPCPSFSSGVILGPRPEDLGRSSSGSAFAPYSASATSPGFNSHLPYGGEPRAAATLSSFVGPAYDPTSGISGSLDYHPFGALGPYPYGDPTYRKNATRDATATLKAWLNEHRKNPYPTKGEKIMLAIITKMTLTQVSTWFANARRRLKKENKMTWTPRNRSEDEEDEDNIDPAETTAQTCRGSDEPLAPSHGNAEEGNVRFVYRRLNMGPGTEDDPGPTAAFLCSLLSLGVSPGLGLQMFELYRLQTAALRRRRQREMMDRERRRRQYLRRRRAFLLSSIAAALSLLSTTSRLVWVRARGPGQNLWATAEAFDDEEWKAQFRVSRATFDYVLELIGPTIKRRRTNYRVPIEPRRRLAITLWWFARSGEYRSIADMFGVGIATVCMIVRQVSSAIVQRLFHRFVSLPSGPRLDDTLQAFKDRCYPQCAGAIGGTHIPIAPPRENPDHYVNKSGWHSVILQAVVDHNVRFTDVYAGWPGSSSTAAVLSGSDLYLKAEDRPDGYLFPREVSGQRSVLSDGVEIPVHLIGDASFPLKPWLMKGYRDEQQQPPERRRFTRTLTSARCVVDAAFARLKGRWRCLLKKSDIDISMMPRVVAACCVLHNICETRGDSFLPEWSVEVAPETYLRQPDPESYDGDSYCTAEVIRDTITYNLLTILQY